MAFAQSYRSPLSTTPIEYHELIIDLREGLKTQGLVFRVEYGGSAFKGTRIDSSDYDNLFVKTDASITAYPSPRYPECALLKQGQYGAMMDPTKQRSQFQGAVQRALNALGLQDKAKVHDNAGISFYPSGWRAGGKPLFTADLVLCYEVADKHGLKKIYAAIPGGDSTGDDAFLWRLVTDVEEKSKIRSIDKGLGIGRWAVRILKAVKGQEASLAVLKSCLFEHILYYLKDAHPEAGFWLESNLKEVIRSMLMYLIEALRRGHLMHYFSHTENLIPQMSEVTKQNVLGHLARLARDPCLQRLLDGV